MNYFIGKINKVFVTINNVKYGVYKYDTLSLSNVGEGIMEFNFARCDKYESMPSWLRITPESGVILPQNTVNCILILLMKDY